MTSLALCCNVASFVFTCMVLATDGAPQEAAYVVLTAGLLLVPLFTAYTLVRAGGTRPSPRGPSAAGAGLRRAAVAANVALLVYACWAYADQYPHPAEEGFVEYVAIVALTPILSVIALLRRRRGAPETAV